MSRVMIPVLVLLVALVAVAQAIDCSTVSSTIDSCSGYLNDPSPDLPGSSCCNAARKLVGLGDVRSLCECLIPISSSFLASKAKKIPAACSVPAFSRIVPCLANSTDVVTDSFLPPFTLPPFPFPPVFPLPPFIPLPPFTSLPPFTPLPPVIPAPPAAA